jgi:HK97 family phage portal protein
MANWMSRMVGFFPSLFGADPGRQPGPDADFWYKPTGTINFSGQEVKPETALAVAAVYGCVRVLRESLGSLPLKVYRQVDDDTVEQARTHPAWRLLQRTPNSWQTAQEWREMGVLHILLQGNFYNRIYGFGTETQLIPLAPDRVKVTQDPSGRLVYEYTPVGGVPQPISQENILHVRGMTLDGISGMSVLQFAKNTVGSSMAQERHCATLFGKGAIPPFWISRPKASRWTDDAVKNFRRNWRRIQAGPENAANPPILQDDMELHALQINNRDLQFIEGRNLNAGEICSFFGVHPSLVFRSEETANNNEEIAQQFKIFTLGPLGTRFEQAIDRDLLAEDDIFCRFNYDSLTRATMRERYEAHNIAVQGGWKLINEVRRDEDLNPLEGGDEPRFPMNMQPAGGAPDQIEQGGQPGRGQPKPSNEPTALDYSPVVPQRTADIDNCFAVLIREAAHRIAASEIKMVSSRADHAEADRDMFSEWLRRGYDAQGRYIARTLSPIRDGWLAGTSEYVDTEELTGRITASAAAIYDHSVPVADTLARWSADRVDEIESILCEGFFHETI